MLENNLASERTENRIPSSSMILRPYGSAERRAIDLLEHSGRLNLLESIRWRKGVETSFSRKGPTFFRSPYTQSTMTKLKVASFARRCAQRSHRNQSARGAAKAIAPKHSQIRFECCFPWGRTGSTNSRSPFGGSKTPFNRDSTNTNLAGHVRRRLAVPSRSENPYPLTSREFIREMGKRLRVEHTDMPIEFVLDDELTAKVIAGAKRVRVREDARFSLKRGAFFVHEIEDALSNGSKWGGSNQPPFSSVRGSAHDHDPRGARRVRRAL